MLESTIVHVAADDRHEMVAVLLPKSLVARLRARCDADGEQVHEVVADAIDLHLDALAAGEDLPAGAIARVLS